LGRWSYGDTLMPTLKLLLFLFGVCALAGGLRTFRLLAIRRRAGRTFPSLHEWSETPLSSWRYEPYSAAAILVHTLAITVLSIAALGAATNPDAFDDSLISNDKTMGVLIWIAEGGSISLVAYLLGSLVAFPLAALRRGPIAFAITEEGILYGHTLMPWHWFSHFSIDRLGGVLRLYSGFSPDLPSLVSKPTASASLAEIGETLQKYLPRQPATTNGGWYRTKHLLLPTMILVCIPLVSVGWLVSHLPRVLALFGVALSTAILAMLGGRLITLFGFGILMIRDDKSRRPPAA
jgi:hypothetical protein